MKKRYQIVYLRSLSQTAIYYEEILNGKRTGVYYVQFHKNV
jgi:hypothetical protein